MLNVTEAINQGFVKFTRIGTETVEPMLNPIYEHWYDRWVQCKVMGKASMKLLRHGMWWMQQQRGQKYRRPWAPDHDGNMCSEDRKYAVYFGKPPLYATYNVCDGRHRYMRICMIPHFKRGQANEMFIFERARGPITRSWNALCIGRDVRRVIEHDFWILFVLASLILLGQIS